MGTRMRASMQARMGSGMQQATRRAAAAEPVAAEAVEATDGMNAAGVESGRTGGGEVGGEDQSPAAEVHRVGYAPIVRVDPTRREIELCATSEAVDSYGTIFSYEASKTAFRRWLGNVREMHERKAVGRRVAVRFDDHARKVFVTIRISRGAQDTWEKICDGTLRGASIGAANVRWDDPPEQWQPSLWPEPDGALKPRVAKKYDLVELSLVDNPSNPDALGFTFVRDAVPDVRLLDRLDTDVNAEVAEADAEVAEIPEIPEIPELNAKGTERSQRRAQGQPTEQEPVAETEGNGSIGSEQLHAAARAVMQSCGCALCEAAMAALAEDDFATDGEMGGDMDAATPRTRGIQGPEKASRVREATLVRALQASLRVSLGSSARRLETLGAQVQAMRGAVDASGEALCSMREQVSQVAASVGETVARAMESTSALDRRLERLEAQPMPGGPAARAVEKLHPLHARDWEREHAGQPVSAQEQVRALEALAGRIADPQAQIAVAAELIRLQREMG